MKTRKTTHTANAGPGEGKHGNRAGTTMVETIVALVLFATFIAGAARVIMMHRQLSDKARAHYTAINIAKNQVEQVRNMRRADYSQILAMQETDVLIDENGTPDENFGRFRRTTTISTNSIPDLLEIGVRIEIKDPITLRFDGENEYIQSFMARLLES